LSDTSWQQHQRLLLKREGDRLRCLLKQQNWQCSGTDLFQWISDHHLQQQSQALCHFMAERGIWLRWFEEGAYRPHGVRFGLPANEAGWQRLQLACAEWTSQI
jgi:cobalamin biosynthetic protein CobC